MYVITKQDVEKMIANMESGNVALGACTYSGPCVIGSGLPQEVIDELVATGSNGTSISMVHHRGQILFAEDIDAAQIYRAQGNFDMGEYDRVVPRLKQAIGEV
jgi:hypothetical protein